MEGGKIEERIGGKRGRDEKGKMGRLEKRPSGMVVVEEYSGDEMINGVKYEEEKITSGGGEGLFNQLITNLVSSPKSNPPVKADVFYAGSEKKDDGGSGSGGGNGGGVINNLISNIFSSNGSGGGEEVVVEKEGGGGGGGGEVVVKDGENDGDDGGGNAIDNIVAKLPRTLSEDAVPATDEASILLHSIIHD